MTGRLGLIGMAMLLMAVFASIILMPRGGSQDIYIPAPDWQAPQPIQPVVIDPSVPVQPAVLSEMLSPEEIGAIVASQGFVLCSGDQWSETEDGLQITCPSTGGILMLKNPANLEDENPIPGLPAPPPHLQNHPRGEYTAKLKRLGWWKVVFAMHDYHTNGGKPPDWCGIREDGALFVVYYSVQVLTKVGGRVYQGFALLLHTNGVSESTVFPKVVPGQNGLPYTGNSGQEPAETFTPIDPRQCPPPPPMVTS